MNAAQEMAAKRWAKADAREKQRAVIAKVNEERGLGEGSRGGKAGRGKRKPRKNQARVKP